MRPAPSNPPKKHMTPSTPPLSSENGFGIIEDLMKWGDHFL